jgi:hypothetical protein
VDWQRLWLERLHARIVAKGFPPRDAFRHRVRAALAAHRELALFLNDSRRKGRAHPFSVAPPRFLRKPRFYLCG